MLGVVHMDVGAPCRLETAIKKPQTSIKLSLAAGAAGNEHLGKDAGEYQDR
jgi:hypothetical protein